MSFFRFRQVFVFKFITFLFNAFTLESETVEAEVFRSKFFFRPFIKNTVHSTFQNIYIFSHESSVYQILKEIDTTITHSDTKFSEFEIV